MIPLIAPTIMEDIRRILIENAKFPSGPEMACRKTFLLSQQHYTRKGVLISRAWKLQPSILQPLACNVSRRLLRKPVTSQSCNERPTFAFPMNQKPLDSEIETEEKNKGYNDWERSFGGFHLDFSEKKGDDDTPEQKKAFYEGL